LVELRGDVEDVNSLLSSVMVAAESMLAFDVFIIVSDGEATDVVTTFTVWPLCDPGVVTLIAGIVFRSNLFEIEVSFDRMVYISNDATPQCKDIFEANSCASLGAGVQIFIPKFIATVEAEDGSVLVGFTELAITLGSDSTIIPDDVLAIHNDTSLKLCNGKSFSRTANAVLTSKLRLPPTNQRVSPTVMMRSKTTSLGLCDDLIISANTAGAGPWPVKYTWTEPSGQLLASLSTPFPSGMTDIFVKSGDYPGVVAKYQVCVVTTAMYTNLESALVCISISTSPNALPQMMAPSVPSLVAASCLDRSFSLNVPHEACNNPDAALDYVWSLRTVAGETTLAESVPGPWNLILNPRLVVRMSDLTSSDIGLRPYYVASLSVSVRGASVQFTTSLEIPISIECPSNIVIMGGTEQTHSKLRSIKLISIVTDSYVPSSEATHTWTCINAATGPCLDANFNPLALPPAPDLGIPAGALDLGVYDVTVCANEKIGRAACTTVKVNIIPDCLQVDMKVNVQGLSATRVAEHAVLSFGAVVVPGDSSADAEPMSFEWNFGRFDSNVYQQTAWIPNSIDAPILPSGTFQRFEFTAKQSIPKLSKSLKGKAVIVIEIPPAPFGGVINLGVAPGADKTEIQTSGWVGEGAVMYECFFVAGEVTLATHASKDRIYLTLARTSIPVFAAEYLPAGTITVGVVASNLFGSTISLKVVVNPENPNLGNELAEQQAAVVANCVLSKNVMPGFQLFGVFGTTLSGSGKRRRRQETKQMQRRATASQDEQMMIAWMNFNFDSVASLGYDATIQAQFQTVLNLKTNFDPIEGTTKDTAFRTTVGILSKFFEDPFAPKLTTELAQKAMNLLVPLEHVLLVTKSRNSASSNTGMEEQTASTTTEYGENMLELMMNVAKGAAGGPDAPETVGAVLPLNDLAVHPDLDLTISRFETQTFAKAVVSVEAPSLIGLLVLDSMCPIVETQGVPSLGGGALSLASPLVVFDSYTLNGDVVTSSADSGSVHFELNLISSLATSRKLLCAQLLADEWSLAGIETTVIASSKTMAGCTIPANRSAGPTTLAIFEDLSITTTSTTPLTEAEETPAIDGNVVNNGGTVTEDEAADGTDDDAGDAAKDTVVQESAKLKYDVWIVAASGLIAAFISMLFVYWIKHQFTNDPTHESVFEARMGAKEKFAVESDDDNKEFPASSKWSQDAMPGRMSVESNPFDLIADSSGLSPKGATLSSLRLTSMPARKTDPNSPFGVAEMSDDHLSDSGSILDALREKVRSKKKQIRLTFKEKLSLAAGSPEKASKPNGRGKGWESLVSTSESIGGLISEHVYFVLNAKYGSFQLAASSGGNAIKFETSGNDSQTIGEKQVPASIVSVTASTIQLAGHGFNEGDAVAYFAQAAANRDSRDDWSMKKISTGSNENPFSRRGPGLFGSSSSSPSPGSVVVFPGMEAKMPPSNMHHDDLKNTATGIELENQTNTARLENQISETKRQSSAALQRKLEEKMQRTKSIRKKSAKLQNNLVISNSVATSLPGMAAEAAGGGGGALQPQAQANGSVTAPVHKERPVLNR
jgi:hypothetical protein